MAASSSSPEPPMDDGYSQGLGRLLERNIVEEHALAVAEHGVRDEHPLAQFPALQLTDEVAPGD